jgi:hypothetical protein
VLDGMLLAAIVLEDRQPCQAAMGCDAGLAAALRARLDAFDALPPAARPKALARLARQLRPETEPPHPGDPSDPGLHRFLARLRTSGVTWVA